MSDEGLLAYGGERVAQGQIPNNDFVTLQPPLSFYAAALAFKIFGFSLLSLRYVGIILSISVTLLVFALCRKVSTPMLSFAAAIPAIFLGMYTFRFVPYAVWYGIAFSLLSIFFLLKAMETNKISAAFVAGLAAALAIISRHDQGTYISIVIFIVMAGLLIRKQAPEKRAVVAMMGACVSGMGVILVPCLFYWQLKGAILPMFTHLVLFPITTYAKTSSVSMPRLNGSLSVVQNLSIMLFYIPPMIQALTAILLVKDYRRKKWTDVSARTACILVIAILFYGQVLTRSDIHHLIIGLAPSFVLCSWLLGRTGAWLNAKRENAEETPMALQAGIAAAAIAGFFLYFVPTYQIICYPLPEPNRPLQIDRGGVKLSIPDAEMLEQLVAMVRETVPSDRSILVLPYQPMIYFLTNRRNPTRWNYLWPGDQTREEHRQLMQQADKDPPAFVLLFNRDEFRKSASEVLEYVDAKFRVWKRGPGMELMVPR